DQVVDVHGAESSVTHARTNGGGVREEVTRSDDHVCGGGVAADLRRAAQVLEGELRAVRDRAADLADRGGADALAKRRSRITRGQQHDVDVLAPLPSYLEQVAVPTGHPAGPREEAQYEARAPPAQNPGSGEMRSAWSTADPEPGCVRGADTTIAS